MNQTATNVIKWIVTLCIPFMMGFYMITFVIAPWYPTWEYAKPNFPPDPAGWTQEQRLELALVAVDFLSRPEPASEVIYLLEEQTIPGTSDPLYNEREIDHMFDVKVRADVFRRLTRILAVFVVAGIAFLLYRSSTEGAAYLAIRNGGLATIAILTTIGAIILLAWDFFFVQFHELLFPPGTWTFRYTDSLIRLFPNKLWFDVGVLIVGGTLALGVIVAIIGHLAYRSSPAGKSGGSKRPRNPKRVAKPKPKRS